MKLALKMAVISIVVLLIGSGIAFAEEYDLNYYLEEIANYEEGLKKEIGILVLETYIGEEEPDVEEFKSAIQQSLSQEEKQKIIDREGSLQEGLDNLDVLENISLSDRLALIEAVKAGPAGIDDLRAITEKYSEVFDEVMGDDISSGGGGGIISVTDVPLDIKTTEGVAEINITENYISDLIKNTKAEDPLKIGINGKDIQRFEFILSKETVNSLKETNKSLLIEMDGVVLDIVDAISNNFKSEIEIIVERISEEDYKPNNTTYKVFKVLNTVYNFEIKSGSENSQSDFLFGEYGSIQLDFNIEKLDNMDIEKLGVYHFNEDKQSWEYVGGEISQDKKTISFMAEHFSKYAVMEYVRAFNDINNHWAKADIEKLAAKHLVDGTDESNFMPEEKITRAEFVTMLYRMLKLDYKEEEIIFKDVDNKSWFYKYVMGIYKEGLVNGTDSFNFSPNDYITREQMAVIIKRVLTQDDYVYEETILDNYNDSNVLSNWAKEGVAYVIKENIMKGRSESTFDGNGLTTRAEAAVVLKRIL